MGEYHKETEKFEQFYKGKLDEKDRQTMMDRLSSDEDFKESYEQYKLLIDGIKYAGRKSMLEKLKSWDKQIEAGQSETPKSRQLFSKWYLIAAILGFFIVAYIVIDSNLNSGYDDVVAQYYQPYNYIPETSRGDSPEKNSLEDIFQYYDRGEYVQTIQLINQLGDLEKTTASDFILASSYQAIEKFEEAISIYKNIVIGDSEYAIVAKWYLALCYLSQENLAMAMPLLEDLQSLNTSYGSKAGTLLKELE